MDKLAVAIPPKSCSLETCPKCGYSNFAHTWGGPVYQPGFDIGTMSKERRYNEMLKYTCKGCGFTHTDPVLQVRDL